MPGLLLLHFYSHTPHGVQLWQTAEATAFVVFLLTHPSRGATILFYTNKTEIPFLLTHPSRGATWNFFSSSIFPPISTHTPLTGCNATSSKLSADVMDFYSHTPHGVQPEQIFYFSLSKQFLLTHPSRGATNIRFSHIPENKFLLTHPSRGATRG